MSNHNTTCETLYGLSAEVLATREAFQNDAEERNIARGCTCKMPTYRHYFDQWPLIRTFVDHTDDDCPRRAS